MLVATSWEAGERIEGDLATLSSERESHIMVEQQIKP
jgi:hypothetical protein